MFIVIEERVFIFQEEISVNGYLNKNYTLYKR